MEDFHERSNGDSSPPSPPLASENHALYASTITGDASRSKSPVGGAMSPDVADASGPFSPLLKRKVVDTEESSMVEASEELGSQEESKSPAMSEMDPLATTAAHHPMPADYMSDGKSAGETGSPPSSMDQDDDETEEEDVQETVIDHGGLVGLPAAAGSERNELETASREPVASETMSDRSVKNASYYEEEMKRLWNGTHPKLLSQRKALQKRLEEKIWMADLWKSYQLEVAQKLYDAEKRQAEKEFEAEKNLIKDKMIQELNERKQKFIEERNWPTLGEQNYAQEYKSSRKLRTKRQAADAAHLNDGASFFRSSNSSSSKKNATGPTIHFSLSENDVEKDLMQIRSKVYYPPVRMTRAAAAASTSHH